ncbi:hypothetical protein DYB38_000962 [Aphanomyces astaci]|uniref:Serine carboxypeptidase S28 n=1 Tax=Aphanomyces astaci TaxID=112090 RepID=A0A397CRZ2_APHAT|nr:hypothetical protein DYB38_000962 [Aphanomyces astaci]
MVRVVALAACVVALARANAAPVFDPLVDAATAAVASTPPISLENVPIPVPSEIEDHFQPGDYVHSFESPSPSSVFLSSQAGLPDPTKEYWFNRQKVDHTDPTNNSTWNQRFHFNMNHYGGAGFPVFLVIEGEWVSSHASVTSNGYFFNQLAKKHKALIVSLEHRFYGKSQPFADFATPNMKFLTSHQALADIANFQDFFTGALDIKNAKWVAMGGSYAGNLAAWVKLKYPTRFAGTWASSAPVNAKVDFYEFSTHVSKALQYYGGYACVANIQTALERLQSVMVSKEPTDVARLKELFNPCYNFTSDQDRGVFQREIYSKFQRAATSDDLTSTTLAGICHSFADPTLQPLEKLSRFINHTVAANKCTYNSFGGMFFQYNSRSRFVRNPVARPWFYQNCNEFGYGQATNSGYGAFVPLQFNNIHVQTKILCAIVFNISNVDTRVANTNLAYGGLNINVENVVFSTGTNDPWDSLALTNDTGTLNPRSTVVDILESSHCRDMYSPKPTDSGHLKWGHQRIEAAIDSFLLD